jgi:hypothetical protein
MKAEVPDPPNAPPAAIHVDSATSRDESCLNLADHNLDPAMQRLLLAWPGLSLPLRVAITAVLDAASR